MISVIVCSVRPESPLHAQHVGSTIGTEYKYLRLDNSKSGAGICAAYNAGVARAKGDILVFVHEDVFFLKAGWGKVLEEKFARDPQTGLMGVAGGQYLFKDNPAWAAPGRPFIRGRVVHHVARNGSHVLSVYDRGNEDVEVVAVDGLFFAVRRSLFDRIRFDEAIFDGFHFYDLDICMQVRRTHKVVVTHDIPVKHFSGGSFDDVWRKYASRFCQKYAADLPVSCTAEIPDRQNRINFENNRIQLRVTRELSITLEEAAKLHAPIDLPAVMQEAVAHHQAGRLGEASDAYNRILKVDGTYPEALHGLGLIYHQQGNHSRAEGLIHSALGWSPDQAHYLNNLGETQRAQGKWEDARKSYKRSRELNPEYAAPVSGLGRCELESGELAAAKALFQEAHRLKPDYSEPLANLGKIYLLEGNPGEALPFLERAVGIRPENAEAHHHRGQALKALGRAAEANASLQAAVKLALKAKPDYPEAHNNLGNLYKELGQLEEAVAAYRKAIECRPDFSEAYNNLGNALQAQGKIIEATKIYQKALALAPDYPEALNNLGNAFKRQFKLVEATECYHKALALRPDHAPALNNLGGVYKDRGKMKEAMECYRKAIGVQGDYTMAHSNFLFGLLYDNETTPEYLRAEHEKFGARYGGRGVFQFPPRAPKTRLRIGYVSGDFCRHSVSYFLEPVLRNHDKGRVEIFCYSTDVRDDVLTARMKKMVDGWRKWVGLSDQEAAQQVRDDGIDILVDLSGHTGVNRLTVFGYRPAPVQVSYLGYPATTGMPEMDYRITDRWSDPVGLTEAHYTEKLVRLPHSMWCFEGMDDVPEVAPAPWRKNGFVTFGSFNNYCKVTPAMLRTWAKILKGAEGSRLLMKVWAVEPETALLLDVFKQEGVDPGRVVLKGRMGKKEYWDLHGEIDLHLDTAPYNGTRTTVECLWMGVPVLSTAGDQHRSRVGLSLAHVIGLPELAAESEEAYISRAVEFSGKPELLEQWRLTLRERMEKSPLMDQKGFTRGLEDAYFQIWEGRV